MGADTKKAYSVLGDDTGCIVFATQSVVARRNGANELNLEFDEIDSCRRSPEFDQYAEAGVVPLRAKIAAGWWIECDHCYAHVNMDTVDPQYEGDTVVFCSLLCKHEEAIKQTREEHHTQAVIDAACERWPGITPIKTTGCQQFGKSILFNFPNCSAFASWTLGDEFLNMSPADHPAWAAFTGKPVEIFRDPAKSRTQLGQHHG